MTTPIAHGYPDWGRYAAEADVNWLEVDFQQVNVETTYGPFFLGSVRWLGAELEAAAQNARIQIQFWRDAALTLPASQPTFDLTALGRFRGAIPVAGPWMTLLVTPNAAGLFATLRLWTAAGPLMALRQSNFNALLSFVGTAVPVGNTTLGPTLEVAPGAATWYADTNVAVWTAQLQLVRYDGTVRTFSLLTNTSNIKSAQVWLPTTCVQILVNNATAAAGGGSFFLNSHSLHAAG